MKTIDTADLSNVKKHLSNATFPGVLTTLFEVIMDQHGKVFAVVTVNSVRQVHAIGSKVLDNLVRTIGRIADVKVTNHQLKDINSDLHSFAEMSGKIRQVFRRVAPIDNGVEIDIGDVERTTVKITSNKVVVSASDSSTLFHRPSHARSMGEIAEIGDLVLLHKYINCDGKSFWLLIAWLTYTLALPKIPTSKYVILSLQGGMGSGKTQLAKLIKTLVDPGVIGVEVMPKNIQDLSISAQGSHVLAWDNLRPLNHQTSDWLCMAATGSAMATRTLYSDSERTIHQLHVAIVLNGISSLIDQPDLQSRTLPLHLMKLTPESRKTEAEMAIELEADLPKIRRGLFDLISKIFYYRPTVKPISPERMIELSIWMAAMEPAMGMSEGFLQKRFTEVMKEGQREALLDDDFSSAFLTFCEKLKEEWRGTPASLLKELNDEYGHLTHRSSSWPPNAISLSKKLRVLQAPLASQSIAIEFARQTDRIITITCASKF